MIPLKGDIIIYIMLLWWMHENVINILNMKLVKLEMTLVNLALEIFLHKNATYFISMFCMKIFSLWKNSAVK